MDGHKNPSLFQHHKDGLQNMLYLEDYERNIEDSEKELTGENTSFTGGRHHDHALEEYDSDELDKELHSLLHNEDVHADNNQERKRNKRKQPMNKPNKQKSCNKKQQKKSSSNVDDTEQDSMQNWVQDCMQDWNMTSTDHLLQDTDDTSFAMLHEGRRSGGASNSDPFLFSMYNNTHAENRKKRVYTPLSRQLLVHKASLLGDKSIPHATIHNIVSTSKIVCIPPKNKESPLDAQDVQDKGDNFFLVPACIDLDQIYSLIPCSHYNRKKFAAITIRISEPTVTALLFTSGRLVITGSKSW